MTELTMKDIFVKRIKEQQSLIERTKEIFEPLKQLFYTEIEQKEEQIVRSFMLFKKEITTTKNFIYAPLDIDYRQESGNFDNLIVSISFKIIETTNVNTKQKRLYKRDNFRDCFRITPEISYMSVEDLDKKIQLSSWILEIISECPSLRIDESILKKCH